MIICEVENKSFLRVSTFVAGDEFKFLQVLDNTPYVVGIEINNTSYFMDYCIYGEQTGRMSHLLHIKKIDPTHNNMQAAVGE